MNGFDFYSNEIPEFITELCESAPMQRLKDVGMNCGCEYTNFPRFTVCDPYSRYEHSVGVGLIVWHFTGDVKQSIAGILHDIATPVFAHVIDFLRGDHLTQESTEDGTREIIAGCAEIQAVLKRYGLTTDDVCDYHKYPIADNDTPMLSADRLEYTLGNAVNYRFTTLGTVKALYSDLTVGKNEHGDEEIMFRTPEKAQLFGELAMRCSEVYVADEDRYSMQALAELLKGAVQDGVISVEDFSLTETEILAKLRENEKYAAQWKNFRAMTYMKRSNSFLDGYMKIPAKKRYIDPYINNLGRLSGVDNDYKLKTAEFVSRSLDYYVKSFTWIGGTTR